MTLTAGTKLGPYEIIAPLGAGGMGEVYQARDTRLDRTVAIKILPSHLSDDVIRRQRFEREANRMLLGALCPVQLGYGMGSSRQLTIVSQLSCCP